MRNNLTKTCSLIKHAEASILLSELSIISSFSIYIRNDASGTNLKDDGKGLGKLLNRLTLQSTSYG